MRGFAGLLAYLVVEGGIIISIGSPDLMARQPPIERTSSAPTVAVESHKERLAKPVNQTIAGQKKARSNQKHQMVHMQAAARVLDHSRRRRIRIRTRTAPYRSATVSHFRPLRHYSEAR